MALDTLLPWLLTVALLTLRLTFAIALSPAFAAYRVPVLVRVALVLVLAALACAQRPPAQAAVAAAGDLARVIPAAGAEVIAGALLGLGAHVVLAALSLAGRLLDVQTGFGIGSIFDPVSGAGTSVLGALVGLLGVTLFIAADAHLVLADLVARSIEVYPLGTWPVLEDPIRPLLAAGSLFTLGLALAAPVAAALVFTDVAVGAVSRNVPQLNVLVLAMPLKIVVAYAMLALTLGGWGALVVPAFERLAHALEGR
jgi:flagellar biosynthesis protein FliR